LARKHQRLPASVGSYVQRPTLNPLSVSPVTYAQDYDGFAPFSCEITTSQQAPRDRMQVRRTRAGGRGRPRPGCCGKERSREHRRVTTRSLPRVAGGAVTTVTPAGARGHLLALLAPRKAGWLAAAAAAAGGRAPGWGAPNLTRARMEPAHSSPPPFPILLLRRPRLRLRPSFFLCACARVPPPSINPLRRPRRGGPRRQAGQGTDWRRGIHAARRRRSMLSYAAAYRCRARRRAGGRTSCHYHGEQ